MRFSPEHESQSAADIVATANVSPIGNGFPDAAVERQRADFRGISKVDPYAEAANVIERLNVEQAPRAAREGRECFVAVLAHELRGPLAALQNAIDLLGRPGIPSQLHEQAIGIARRQLGQAAQLVDDLFDLARLGASKLVLRKQTLQVKDVLQMALDVSRPRLEAAGIELQINVVPEALALSVDPARFAQVIANLLNNAAKFTGRNGKVQVNCSQTDDWVTLKIADNGIGMRPETLARAFDAFEQAADEVDQNRGLGLGLPLARRIVELHGGRIGAYSDGLGSGTVLTIDVPRSRPA